MNFSNNSPRLAPLITAIGMSILLQTLAMIIWKPQLQALSNPVAIKPFDIAGAVITPTQILVLVVTALMLTVLMYLVNYTRLGRAMRATAKNPRVAALMGIKPEHGDLGYFRDWCCVGHYCRSALGV